MREMQGLVGSLLYKAEGHWRFTPTESGGTDILWTYRAYPHSSFTRPFGWIVVNMFLKGAMQNCLTLVKKYAEEPDK